MRANRRLINQCDQTKQKKKNIFGKLNLNLSVRFFGEFSNKFKVFPKIEHFLSEFITKSVRILVILIDFPANEQSQRLLYFTSDWDKFSAV